MRSSDNRHTIAIGGESTKTPISDALRQKLLVSLGENPCAPDVIHCTALLPQFDISESSNSQFMMAAAAPPQAREQKHASTPFAANRNHTYEQVMNQATIIATMKNEEAQRRPVMHIWGNHVVIDIDGMKDKWAEHVGGDFDVGPAKMSAKQIRELKNNPRYNNNLKNIDNLSEDGAKKLIDAYFRREMDRFNNGDYRVNNPAKFNADRPRDINKKIIRGNFNFAQELWDKARAEGDTDTMRKVLIESYNAGKHTVQIKEVERIRTGDPDWSHVDVRKWEKKHK